jgi:hypothetical protein
VQDAPPLRAVRRRAAPAPSGRGPGDSASAPRGAAGRPARGPAAPHARRRLRAPGSAHTPQAAGRAPWGAGAGRGLDAPSAGVGAPTQVQPGGRPAGPIRDKAPRNAGPYGRARHTPRAASCAEPSRWAQRKAPGGDGAWGAGGAGPPPRGEAQAPAALGRPRSPSREGATAAEPPTASRRSPRSSRPEAGRRQGADGGSWRAVAAAPSWRAPRPGGRVHATADRFHGGLGPWLSARPPRPCRPGPRPRRDRAHTSRGLPRSPGPRRGRGLPPGGARGAWQGPVGGLGPSLCGRVGRSR